MAFIDRAEILLKAGNGGNGAVSFHREKFVMRGGPDGGDGGNGGSIIFQANSNMNTLTDFKIKPKYRAGDGDNGGTKNMTGKSGEDVVISVPTGTIIKDKQTGKVIADLFYDKEQKTLLTGGKGGKGNARFAKPTRQAPEFSQQGIKTQEVRVILELKTIADVGLVGFPNVGKSTLLSVLTNARPKIANYHFTTLTPGLGAVKYYDTDFVIADIPGLIEGASDGAGLGHEFLRHIERVRLIVHLVDLSGSEGREPVEDFAIINKELEDYSQLLSKKPQIVVANKADILGGEAEQAKKEFEKQMAKVKGKNVLPKVVMISAAARQGLEELLNTIYAELKKLPDVEPMSVEQVDYDVPMSHDFEVVVKDGIFEVTGGLVRMIERNVRFDDPESLRYFQRILKEKGVLDALRQKGVKDGDTVVMSDIEFDFVE